MYARTYTAHGESRFLFSVLSVSHPERQHIVTCARAKPELIPLWPAPRVAQSTAYNSLQQVTASADRSTFPRRPLSVSYTIIPSYHTPTHVTHCLTNQCLTGSVCHAALPVTRTYPNDIYNLILIFAIGATLHVLVLSPAVLPRNHTHATSNYLEPPRYVQPAPRPSSLSPSSLSSLSSSRRVALCCACCEPGIRGTLASPWRCRPRRGGGCA